MKFATVLTQDIYEFFNRTNSEAYTISKGTGGSYQIILLVGKLNFYKFRNKTLIRRNKIADILVDFLIKRFNFII
jgi:hypothetical protein